MGIGAGFMFTVKLLLSALLLILALVVLFGGDWSWGRPVGALFFLALTALTWSMHFPRRVRGALLGLLFVALSIGLLHLAFLAANGTIAFPADCTRSRRVLGCQLWNALHAAGGVPLISALWALFGVAGLAVGASYIRGNALRRRASP